jgi:hypothetical protein
MDMKGRNVLQAAVLVAFCAIAGPRAAVLPAGPAAVDAKAAFERLKTLEGTWQSAGAEGKSATTVFELTANGTVLLERYTNPAMAGGAQMVTAYYLDGSSLVLTHYCIARNQPTLKADRFDASTGEIQFEFVRATNLPSENAGHMRRAFYRMDDASHFTTSWEFFENGKKKMTETERFQRTKN